MSFTSFTPGQAAVAEAIAAKVMGDNKEIHILPVYLSGYIEAMLMGLIFSQGFAYWRYVKTDKRHIVGLVVLALLATTISSVLVLCWAVDLFVWHFDTYIQFTEFQWCFKFMGLEIASVIIVQTFYIDRACRIWKHWWPALIIAPFAIAGATVGGVLLYSIPDIFPFGNPDQFDPPIIKPLSYAWLSIVLVTDFLITGLITFGLSRIKTGWSDTDSKLRRASIRCFESQTPALISSIIMLIIWNRAFPVALACGVLQSKIYTLGMMITLIDRGGPNRGANVYTSTSGNTNGYTPSNDRRLTLSGNPPHSSVISKAEDATLSRGGEHSEIEMANVSVRAEKEDSDVAENDFGSTTGLNQVGYGRASG